MLQNGYVIISKEYESKISCIWNDPIMKYAVETCCNLRVSAILGTWGHIDARLMSWYPYSG